MTSDSKSKIILTLQQRREIDAAIQDMRHASSEADLEQRALEIASHGDAVIRSLIAHLDTDNATIRGGLGRLARHLDQDKVIPALEAAAMDRQCSDRARLTAITILERFLSRELDGHFFEGLRRPEDVALESLREALDAAEENQFVLLEYTRQLSEQPIEVGLATIAMTTRLPPERTVELLRLLAQEPRREIARAALQALGSARTARAVVALQGLLVTLPPDLRPLAERSLRKLQFSGVPVADLPQPDEGWRALVSPIDREGTQTLWFIHSQEDAAHSRFLGLLLDDRQGLRAAFGDEKTPTAQLPTLRAVGTVHQLPMLQGGPVLLLLEASFDYGRQLVRQALQHNFANQSLTPPEYRLLNPYLWEWAPPDETFLPPEPPNVPIGEAELDAQMRRLIARSPCQRWFLESEQVYDTAMDLLRQGANDLVHPLALAAVSRLLTAHFDEDTIALYYHRLLAMATWLKLAGESELAKLAALAAATLSTPTEKPHPFLWHLTATGLAVALAVLQTAGTTAG
ncbi:MAG TPA: hypothetical protein EYP04_05665 [Anaerolineae bacterium]|nr:hypothetical protein [Anaerolineae bacterium]HIQ04844.1 hypothetical protein [Anaerolineae bacterium]